MFASIRNCIACNAHLESKTSRASQHLSQSLDTKPHALIKLQYTPRGTAWERREYVCSSVHAKPSTPSHSFDPTPQIAWTNALNSKCWCLTASGHWGRHACHRPILQERRGVGLTVTTREVGFGLRVWGLGFVAHGVGFGAV